MRDYPAIDIQMAIDGSLLDLIAPIVDDFGPTAVEEPDAGRIRVYFTEPGGRDAALAAVQARCPGARLYAIDVPDENWAERSQASLTAVGAGALTVAPPWDAPEGATPTTIVINPAMGFGTGHHATTRLCLIALQEVGVAGKTVLDVGTGSGVLAIAAARLGAARVVAIDNDRDAIDNALENQALNGTDAEFRCVELEAAALDGPFDVVVANLTGAVLVRFATVLSALTADGGRLILSGLREEEERGVVTAFGRAPARRTEDDGWLCIVLD